MYMFTTLSEYATAATRIIFIAATGKFPTSNFKTFVTINPTNSRNPNKS